MASNFLTTEAQEPMLFEDLAVYFSQEECVSILPAQSCVRRDATEECLEDVALMGGEGSTEMNQQLSLEPMEPEELALEKYSIAAPLVHYPEKSSEDEVGNPERTVSGGTSTCKKRFISLLVTIENHTPLVELSQCLRTSTLSEIFVFPWEETKNMYKCPECDQSFSDNSYLVLHQKTHSEEKKYRCSECGKIFKHRANLRTHRRIHTGKKPYKCDDCGTSFRQHSHLSRHMNSHIKEKPYTCSICGRGFIWLPGLAQHQKSHTTIKVCESANHGNYFGQKTNLALHEQAHTSATQYQYSPGGTGFGQPSYPSPLEKDHKEDSKCCSDDDDFFSFSKFKPLWCPECEMTFPCFSELISHQNLHMEEKHHTCSMCAKCFTVESELAFHQKSHTREEPFRCTVCGKSFKINMHLITHKQTHMKKIL